MNRRNFFEFIAAMLPAVAFGHTDRVSDKFKFTKAQIEVRPVEIFIPGELCPMDNMIKLIAYQAV